MANDVFNQPLSSEAANLINSMGDINGVENVQATVTPNTEEGTSILDHAGDVFIGAVGGAAKAWNATNDLVYSGLKYAENQARDDVSPEEKQFKDRESPTSISEERLPKPKLWSGELASDLAQFAVPYVGVTKLAALAKIGQAATVAGRIGEGMAKGAVVDFISTRADAENFFGTIAKEYPEVGELIPDFLENDGDDDHMTGRLANVLAGAGMGMVADLGLETTIKLFKSGRAALRFTKEADAQDALKKQGVIKDIQPTSQAQNNTPDAQPKQATATQTNTTAPAISAEDTLNKIDNGEVKFTDLDKASVDTLLEACKNSSKTRARLISDPNFHTYGVTTREGRAFLLGVARIEADQLDNATAQSFASVKEAVKKLNDTAGFDSSNTIEYLEKATDGVKAAVEYRAQLAPILSGLTNEAGQVANRLLREAESVNGMSNEGKVNLVLLYKSISNLYMADKNFGTALARGLNARKITDSPVPNVITKDGRVDMTRLLADVPDFKTAKEAEDWLIKEGVSDEAIKAVAEVVQKCNGNPSAIFSTVKHLNKASWSKFLSYSFVNNILSGIFTHGWNITSMTTKQFTEAVGRIAGGALSGDMADFKESCRYTYALMTTAMEAFGYMSINLLRGGDNIFKDGWFPKNRISTEYKGGKSKYDDVALLKQNPTSVESILEAMKGSNPDAEITPFGNFMAHFLSTISAPARWNSSLMRAEDEVFKQWNFRAQMHASISRRLDEMNKTGKARKEAYEKLKKDFFTDEGLVNTANKDAEEALRLSDRITYSQDIVNNFVRSIEKFSNQHVLVKVIIPFVKTVWNTQVDAVHHIPFSNRFSQQVRDDLAAGGVRRQAALGRMAVGTAALGMVLWASAEGTIVGELSKNPKIRAAQERAGMKEYSIRIGDKYVSFDRFDPFGTLLGTAANVLTVVQSDEDKSYEDLIYTVLGSYIDSVTSKSFLSGMIDFFNIFNGYGSTGEKVTDFGVRTASAFFPASGFIGSAASWLDLGSPNTANRRIRPDNFGERVASTSIGKFANQMGLKAADMPIDYDYITGKPKTSSRFFRDIANDSVRQELALDTIAPYILGEPKRLFKEKVELTSEQLSRRRELNGTIKINGKTLYQALQAEIESPSYDKERKKWIDEDNGKKSWRAKKLEKIIRRYRDAADVNLIREYPELLKKLDDAKAAKRDALRRTTTQGASLSTSLFNF
jgi:hypothetical protein